MQASLFLPSFLRRGLLVGQRIKHRDSRVRMIQQLLRGIQPAALIRFHSGNLPGGMSSDTAGTNGPGALENSRGLFDVL